MDTRESQEYEYHHLVNISLPFTQIRLSTRAIGGKECGYSM